MQPNPILKTLGYSDDDLELWYGWVDVYVLTPVPDPEDILYILP